MNSSHSNELSIVFLEWVNAELRQQAHKKRVKQDESRVTKRFRTMFVSGMITVSTMIGNWAASL